MTTDIEAARGELGNVERGLPHHHKQRQEPAEPSTGRQEMQRLREEQRARPVRHGEGVAVARFEQSRKTGNASGQDAGAPIDRHGRARSGELQGEYLADARVE